VSRVACFLPQSYTGTGPIEARIHTSCPALFGDTLLPALKTGGDSGCRLLKLLLERIEQDVGRDLGE